MLIHIGTRDLQTQGAVKNEDFNNLLSTTIKLWPDAKIFILPIIRRKDMANETILTANDIIQSECDKHETITLINKFEPSDDMFFDSVHMNNKKGLPEIVKHLKTAMKMYPPGGPKISHQSSNGNQHMLRPQTMPSNQRFINNAPRDTPLQFVPNNSVRPPWFTPPPHLPPWQPPPLMWNPYVQFNPMAPSSMANSYS